MINVEGFGYANCASRVNSHPRTTGQQDKTTAQQDGAPDGRAGPGSSGAPSSPGSVGDPPNPVAARSRAGCGAGSEGARAARGGGQQRGACPGPGSDGGPGSSGWRAPRHTHAARSHSPAKRLLCRSKSAAARPPLCYPSSQLEKLEGRILDELCR